MNHGLILFGHGSRDPEWARPLREVAAQVAAGDAAPQVELAFLEFLEPTLEQACDRLAAAGITRIAVLPMFIAQSGHVRRDLPAQLDAVRARHPSLRIDLATAVGEDPRVQAVMAEVARAALAG
ncbi:sirohydrochlorin chelatase [Methyloversatilis discipulorum]|uniref:sirohydrochlorin chelatase n=1 Tax=Methyloversatilis discipulorum TaxID=1119528 RepID=UPI001A5127EE|nr:CbiX/SirB N-terminal domain-containing protein [Methyloversatilis discipulorum]MBL8468735.1 CbiX/SirB N-terminal domain-containing protein [Methyloversatilis discipulorum]